MRCGDRGLAAGDAVDPGEEGDRAVSEGREGETIKGLQGGHRRDALAYKPAKQGRLAVGAIDPLLLVDAQEESLAVLALEPVVGVDGAGRDPLDGADGPAKAGREAAGVVEGQGGVKSHGGGQGSGELPVGGVPPML
jgi:hypothetical protein